MTRIVLLLLGLLLAGCTSGTSAQPTAVPCDPGPPGTREVTVGNRSFLLHVPRDLPTPAPAVMTLHGRGSNAQQQLLLTGFAQLAEEGRFLVVAPDARGGRWDVTGQRDVAYLDRVLDAVPCLDPARVYAAGMSMGSAMTFALACQPQRRFAAFGGVALAAYQPVCAAAPPAPIIYFHGTADPIVAFRGGTPQGESVTLPPVPAAMREWAAHNGCTADTLDRTADVTLREWTQCDANADVDYYRVRRGGHTWPGAEPFIADAIEQTLGRTTQTVDASRLMWEFFQGYRLG
jgi:polyhydroxybutyrate depolymerase